MSDSQQKKAGKISHRYFRPLREGGAIEYCVESCLPAHSHYADCRQCEQACPVKALRFTGNAVEVNVSCVGCGQCAAACPTGALGVPGFALPALSAQRDAPLFVDCWKIPSANSARDAYRVPCLGGLSLSRLMELRVAAGTRPIVLMDRGWCDSCPAGMDGQHPVSACLSTVQELLLEMHIPQGQWPQLESHPLPKPAHQSETPDRSNQRRIGRRAFFSDLAARVTHTASEINPLTSGKQPPVACGHEREPVRSRERSRLLSQVSALSESAKVPVPASLYPAVQIDPQRCEHHRLCAATCPTGALSAFDSSGVSGVVFDSSGCIACGHCEAICASGALKLLPHGDGHLPVRPKVVVRIRQRECTSCGRPFEGAADDTLCPHCSKRTALAQSAFQTLFGRPN